MPNFRWLDREPMMSVPGPTRGSRQHSKMSAMEGRPDGRRTRPEPPFLTRSRPRRRTETGSRMWELYAPISDCAQGLDEELRLYFRYSACEFGWCFTCLVWHHLLCENWAGVVFRLDQMNT